MLGLSDDLFVASIADDIAWALAARPTAPDVNDEKNGERETDDKMNPARAGAKALVADVIKCIAARNEERDNCDEENAVRAIAMCAPRIFHVQRNERADEH